MKALNNTLDLLRKRCLHTIYYTFHGKRAPIFSSKKIINDTFIMIKNCSEKP